MQESFPSHGESVIYLTRRGAATTYTAAAAAAATEDASLSKGITTRWCLVITVMRWSVFIVTV